VSEHEHDRAREALGEALRRTPACIPIERLGEPLGEAERAHVDGCARCQAELALLEAFEQDVPAPDEGAAVRWVAAEAKRRGTPAGGDPSVARRSRWPRFVLVTSAAAVLLLVGYMTLDREPRVAPPISTEETYRSAEVRVVSPMGDVASPPGELVWAAVRGAVRYDVSVFEVDRTILWRGTSTRPRVELPTSLVSLFAPGKTVLWQVSATNASGDAVARSSTVRFRVVPHLRVR
jgi:hypothetical protein